MLKKCNYYQHFLFVNRLNNRDKINEDHKVCEEDRKVFLIIILINVSLILSLALRQFIIMTRIEQHELLMCWMFLSALHNCDLEELMIVGQLLLRVLQEVLIGCHRGNAVLMLTEAKKQFERGDLFEHYRFVVYRLGELNKQMLLFAKWKPEKIKGFLKRVKVI